MALQRPPSYLLAQWSLMSLKGVSSGWRKIGTPVQRSLCGSYNTGVTSVPTCRRRLAWLQGGATPKMLTPILKTVIFLIRTRPMLFTRRKLNTVPNLEYLPVYRMLAMCAHPRGRDSVALDDTAIYGHSNTLRPFSRIVSLGQPCIVR